MLCIRQSNTREFEYDSGGWGCRLVVVEMFKVHRRYTNIIGHYRLSNNFVLQDIQVKALPTMSL